MARKRSEIDKELLYKKLMPSARFAGPGFPETAAPGTEAEPPEAGRAQAPRKVSVPALDNRRMQVVNVMESAVLGKMDSILARFQCCRCDRCKKDILALALNRLPPKYMVLSEGETPPDIGPELNAQVVAAMIQAVLRVRAKPRH